MFIRLEQERAIAIVGASPLFYLLLLLHPFVLGKMCGGKRSRPPTRKRKENAARHDSGCYSQKSIWISHNHYWSCELRESETRTKFTDAGVALRKGEEKEEEEKGRSGKKEKGP